MSDEIDHDEHCQARGHDRWAMAPCDCEAGRLAKMRDGMTAHQAEISQGWDLLESFGFPPEACGWPMRDISGLLPEAIRCALECLIRQREDLLTEVQGMRAASASLSGSYTAGGVQTLTTFSVTNGNAQ